MSSADELIALESSVAEVAVALFAADTVEATLRRIVALAAQTIEGCEAAGILLVDERGTASTLAESSPRVRDLDQMQVDADEGPCLDAARQGTTFYAEDLIDDARWPGFAMAAVGEGVRCVLAYSLSSERMCALNVYSRLPAAFGVLDRAKGQLFATLAGLALDSAEHRASEERRAENLTEALRTRELIGQAQGILMERERITSDQAFDVLRRASQHLNRKLREVAESLVETGESPATNGSPIA